MALYLYQAFNKAGKKITGTLDASSGTAVRDQLGKRGLYPISVIPSSPEKERGFRLASLFERSVSIKDKIMFTKQFAVLLKSGVALVDALELLVDQFEGRFRSILITIKDNVREGKSLAESLGAYPKVFDTTYVQLVRAGEATGRLEIILERLTSYLEKTDDLNKRVKSAMTYPLIQIGIIGVIMIFLMTFVVPKLAETFQRQGQELPGMTKALMSISYFLSHYYLVLLLLLVGVVALFEYWRSTEAGGRLLDRIKLKLPIVKYFTRMSAVVQFSRTLGMLVEGGVNLAESLDIVVKIIDNKILAQELREARDKIIKQGKIAQFLKQTDIFPPIAVHLIKTGEESGSLDTMLMTVAENYEVELNELADGLSTALQPLMLLIMAVVVGFIVYSIARPLMSQSALAGIM
ncbi:type II secretion system F family protein [Candidatus Babeliales bacterium]|nr:type II secretion system F family protein [Candidatus Babeliales bacterium]